MTSAHPADTWSSFDRFSYNADLDLDLKMGAESALACHDAILVAGERHGIFVVEEVEQIGYERARDGFILDYIHDSADAQLRIRQMARTDPDSRQPGGFLLGVDRPEDIIAATRLSYIHRDGGLREERIRDIVDVAREAGIRHGYAGRPVEIVGGLSLDDERLEISIFLSSDIWYPWTFPYGTSEREYRDNRLLAGLNGGRFNEFVREVREVCLSVGGRWQAQDFGDNDEDGFIILDQPRPQV